MAFANKIPPMGSCMSRRFGRYSFIVPQVSEVNRDQVVYRGKTWKRKTLAAFLNLVVLPGTGSFVLGRLAAGWIQIALCVGGFIVKIAAVTSVTIWLNPVLQKLGAESVGELQLKDILPVASHVAEEYYRSTPPEVAGINSLYLFWAGLAMILVGWLYGAVTLFLPDLSQGRGETRAK